MRIATKRFASRYTANTTKEKKKKMALNRYDSHASAVRAAGSDKSPVAHSQYTSLKISAQFPESDTYSVETALGQFWKLVYRVSPSPG